MLAQSCSGRFGRLLKARGEVRVATDRGLLRHYGSLAGNIAGRPIVAHVQTHRRKAATLKPRGHGYHVEPFVEDGDVRPTSQPQNRTRPIQGPVFQNPNVPRHHQESDVDMHDVARVNRYKGSRPVGVVYGRMWLGIACGTYSYLRRQSMW